MSDIDLNVPDHAITVVQRIVVLDEGNAIVWPLSPDEPIQFLTTHAIDDEFEDTIKQTLQYDHVCTQIANRKYGEGWASEQVTSEDYLAISREATTLLGIDGFDPVIEAKFEAMDRHPAGKDAVQDAIDGIRAALEQAMLDNPDPLALSPDGLVWDNTDPDHPDFPPDDELEYPDAQ